MNSLKVENLSARIEDKQILKELNLEIPSGEVHAIMGPNGSGKSTLSKVLSARHPDYEVINGKAFLNNESLLDKEADEIARMGLFLAFQYPVEVAGVTIANFIRAALQSRLPKGESIKAVDYYKELYAKMDQLGMDRKFTSRAKRWVFWRRSYLWPQMSMLEPKFCILDETDSGLDIDALKLSPKGKPTSIR